MPGDTFVVIGAILVGRGQLDFWPAYAATTAGSLLGFILLYLAGRKWGLSVLKGVLGRYFPTDYYETVSHWFCRYGLVIVAANRFMGGIRGVVSLTAGIVNLNFRKVFWLALLSCTIWNALIMASGRWVGENWVSLINRYQWSLGVAVVVIIGFTLLRRCVIRHMMRKTSNQDENRNGSE